MRLSWAWWEVALVVAIGVVLVVPVAEAARIDLFAQLSGSHAYPRAVGHVEYVRSAARRNLEVTVTNVEKLAGKRVTVYVNQKRVGTMLVSDAGRAHREWKTEHGQRVPAASAKSLVGVLTADSLVVSGVLRPDVSG